jgi:hypothetical protein
MGTKSLIDFLNQLEKSFSILWASQKNRAVIKTVLKKDFFVLIYFKLRLINEHKV